MKAEASTRAARPGVGAFTVLLLMTLLVAHARAGAQTPVRSDPRVGLRGGWSDAQTAARNLELVSHRDRPANFANAANPGDFLMANSDLAFAGNLVFQGSFNGFQIWDITNAGSPTLRSSLVCPGGQGDLSVYRHLMFMSVEMPNGRIDCAQGSLQDSVSAQRFVGVRIFDISNIDKPRQVASLQTCRGSHTHTLVTDPRDSTHVYIYVAGTAPPRSKTELAGCSGLAPAQDPNTALFRIEVIRVPVAAPQNARIVSTPRLFADTAGNIAGLWAGGTHGAGTQNTALTDQCHDITAYSEIGLAAGACSGNGILIDIRDPANPKRVDEVMDPNFAYWHAATFSNDGSKVLFTDEWGGGVAARCRETDRPEWGANAIFTRGTGKLRFASYYKLPAPQSAQENCVAHNGSLIPVPGRDIMVQAWYQGGISVFDFTDPAHPVEIAYFDRGPVGPQLLLAGHWSAYWYNGQIIASEIARGLDIFRLTPSEFLSKDEIEAAKLVRMDHFNPQTQTKLVWPASFVVARAYLDGLVRSDGLRKAWATPIYTELSTAERASGVARRSALTS
ncbi:MAG: LVIVD repeat-containing protein, partial [Longimicrobiales bacterium]